jgi:hypothetical protein
LSEFNKTECQETVSRIVSSATFKNSPRLRQFLLYIVECSLNGRTDEIKEHEIGRAVFGREEHYDTMDDSVVRSSARQLRGKIKEYYDSVGRDEKWHLTIPKGHYEVVFTRLQIEPATALPEAPERAAPVPAVRRWQIITGVLTLVIIGQAIGAYQMRRESQKTVEVGRSKTSLTIASTVLKTDEQTKIVIGDYGSSQMTAITHHPFSVEEYANRLYPDSLLKQAKEPPLREIWNGLSNGHAVYFPDAFVAGNILRLSGEEGKRVAFQGARLTRMQDFQSGENVILISSPNENPWVNLFEDKLNFRDHIKTYGDRRLSEFVNTRPLPGESPTYSADDATPYYGVSYGLVARVPSLRGTGKILIIHGLRFTGELAAGDFVTDPSAAAELVRIFKVDSLRDLPDFEVLLKTESLTNSHFNTKVVAFRRAAASVH